MIAIDTHEWVMHAEGIPETPYAIFDGTVDLDDEWSPFTQGRLTLAEEPPTPLGTVTTLVLQMFQSVGPQHQHLRDMTAEFGGGTLADITEAWGGLTFAEVDALYTRIYAGSSAVEPSGRQALVMPKTLTERDDGLWDLSVESLDSRFAEYASTAERFLEGSSVAIAFDDLVDLEAGLIGSFLLTVIDDGMVPAGMVEAYPNEQRIPIEPGQSFLEAASSTMQSANVRLLDFGGGPVLVSADWTNPQTLSFSDDLSVEVADVVVDRDAWFEMLVVVYNRDKTNPYIPHYGASRGSGLFPPVATMLKTRTITIDAPAPFPSSDPVAIERVVRPIADRMRSQGLTTQMRAVANYAAFPRATVEVSYRGDILTGTASRVTYNYAARSMTIDLRQVVLS